MSKREVALASLRKYLEGEYVKGTDFKELLTTEPDPETLGYIQAFDVTVEDVRQIARDILFEGSC